jgi:hypothetical protein
MPVSKSKNPLEPRVRSEAQQQTQKANEARWRDHVPPTSEELLERKKEYYRRSQAKLKENKPVPEESPVNELEVKADESLDSGVNLSDNVTKVESVSEKPAHRQTKAERRNGVFSRVLEEERRFSAQERIRELERICGLNAGEETSYAGIFLPPAPPPIELDDLHLD